MSQTISTSEDILVQNLGFFRRMRNFYFEKTWSLFQKLEATVHGDTDEGIGKTAGLLWEYIETLEFTSEYGHHAIRGNKRKKIKSFRQAPEWGIMEEEVVFVRLVEELLSSSIYLRNRFETNNDIRHYMQTIKERSDNVSDKKGFLSNIITVLEADQRTDREEIIELSKLIHKRFQIANNIYLVLQRHHAPHQTG